MLILNTDETKLSSIINFDLWFYRVAKNMSSPTGIVGRQFLSDEIKHQSNGSVDELEREAKLKLAQNIMLNLGEFENRIIMLYMKYKNMKAVQRETGISYSALRSVKEKIKTIREHFNEITCNNTFV